MIANLVALAALLSLAPVPVADAGPPYAPVRQVVCALGKGTAFRIQGGQMVTAAHVTNNSECMVDGQPITATNESGLDFAVLDQKFEGVGFKVNCGGMVPGEYVFGVGYAYGSPWQTMTQHLATYIKGRDGKRALLGLPTVIPGMSGGVLLNPRGEAVGVITSYIPGLPISFGIELRDTAVCAGK